MNCGVCNNPYSECDQSSPSFIPRVLVSCGHTFCGLCIERSLQNGKLICFQCGKTSQGDEVSSFPVNETVLSFLRTLVKQPQQYLCRQHKLKIDALCETDKQLLCLQCIVSDSQHKSHRISRISEKVKKDKQLLKDCHSKIQQLHAENEQTLCEIDQHISNLQHEYKDYLLEVAIFFKNIHQEIQQREERQLQRGKANLESIQGKINSWKDQLMDKTNFLHELRTMYDELIKMDDIEYLHEENKRKFIMDNCRSKKIKGVNEHLEFHRVACLQDIAKGIEEMVVYERKKTLSNGSNLLGESPMLIKMSSKESPTVLEVNLSEQYQKHQAAKQQRRSKPIKSTITINSERMPVNRMSKQGKKEEHRGSGHAKKDKGKRMLEEALDITDGFAPLSSVSSFMRTSRNSMVNNQLSIKNSQSQFTLLEMEDRVYHFGGIGNNRVQINDGQKNQLLEVKVFRNRCQCVLWPKYSLQQCLILGGKNNTDDTNCIDVIDFSIKDQSLKKSALKLTEGRSGFGAVVKENKLYLIGGHFLGPSNSFEEYVIEKGQIGCNKMVSMNTQRDQASACLGFDGHLYVAGGVNFKNNIVATCERFNWQKLQWSPTCKMNNPRRSFALVALPNGIYAIGGHDGKRYLNQVQFYDYESQKWVQRAPIKQPRCCHTAIISRDYQTITVYGGYNNESLRSVEVYNVVINQWQTDIPMKEARHLHCSILA